MQPNTFSKLRQTRYQPVAPRFKLYSLPIPRVKSTAAITRIFRSIETSKNGFYPGRYTNMLNCDQGDFVAKASVDRSENQEIVKITSSHSCTGVDDMCTYPQFQLRK